MLLIIELLFFVAGMWIIISGKIPTGLFRLLFGKGRYELPSNKARLFGLLLLSPLPVSFLSTLLLTALFGTRGAGYAIIFESIFVVAVIIVSLFIARNSRLSEAQGIDSPESITPSSEQKKLGYGVRLLIAFGIVSLGCITITSAFSLIMTTIASITIGTRWTGDFWADIFPILLMIAVIGLGVFGVVKLAQVLRKNA